MEDHTHTRMKMKERKAAGMVMRIVILTVLPEVVPDGVVVSGESRVVVFNGSPLAVASGVVMLVSKITLLH